MRLLVFLVVAAQLIWAADPAAWISDLGGAVIRNRNGQIVAVDLRSTWVTDSDLGQLAVLPDLSRLNLSLTRIDDHGLQALKSAPAIADLDLRFAEMVSDGGIMAVRGWKHLKRLNLRGTKITDAGLQHLVSVTSIESLDLGYVQVTDVGLDQLASFANLKELTIGGNKLSDMGLQSLRQIPGLTYLDLGGAQRTDSGLWSVSMTQTGAEAVASLRNLRCLGMRGLTLSARELNNLKTLTKLEKLDLQSCQRINDDAIPMLASLPALKVLDVSGTKIDDAGVAQLRKAHPQCTILTGPGTEPARSGKS